MGVERAPRNEHECANTEADLIAAELEDLLALQDKEGLILRFMGVWQRPSTRSQGHLH